jgi:quaternary ammonium compound-resistance protein SugE
LQEAVAVSWFYLIIAGVMEWGWPIGLKYAWTEQGFRFWPAAGAGLSMALSGLFLFLAQRNLPIGTAYAVWTGIGAVGTFVLGILVLGDPVQTMRFVCVGLIVLGIIGLKLTS